MDDAPEVERAPAFEDGFLRSAVLRLLASGDPPSSRSSRCVWRRSWTRGFPARMGSDLEPLKALPLG
jgi:hypothetical protein